MKRRNRTNRCGPGGVLALAAVAALAPAGGARAQDFAVGVRARHGDASPAGGFSAGETNSRVDDYINQDEQLNIAPEDGTIRVLRANQKNLVNEYVTEAIPIRHAKISEILFTAKAIAGKEGGWAEVFFNKDSGEQFVSVVVPPRQLPHVREAIRALDKPWLRLFDDGSVQTTYKARYRPIDVVATIANGWAPFGTTEVDPRANVATHSDEAVWSEMWHKAANMADFPAHQADLDVDVYEVRLDAGLRLGLDYIAWKNGPGRNLFSAVLSGFDSRQSIDERSSVFDPFAAAGLAAGNVLASGSHNASLSASYLITAAYLDFLATKGRARVLNSATLRVTSGREASLDATLDVASFSVAPEAPADGSSAGVAPPGLVRLSLDDEGRPERERGAVVFEPATDPSDTYPRELRRTNAAQVGMSLTFLPSIALESMELGVEMTETRVSGLTPTGEPVIASRTVRSEVRLADGRPFALMGTKWEARIETSNKAPILGSIPVLGKLFGQENNLEGESVLVAVITPRIMALPPNPFERNDWTEGESDALGEEPPVAPDRLAAAMGQASGAEDLPLPAASFGFDQWLLDGAAAE